MDLDNFAINVFNDKLMKERLPKNIYEEYMLNHKLSKESLDILTNEMIDLYHGQDDLKKGIIRHVNPNKFKEDALRVFRGAQFAARFEFQIDSLWFLKMLRWL